VSNENISPNQPSSKPTQVVDEIVPECLRLADGLLARSTGLDLFKRRTVVYWSLATHALDQVARFPLLVIRGSTGTGKSQCQLIVGDLAYEAVRFSMHTSTAPIVRDKLSGAENRTAIIEEGDKGWSKSTQFEDLLSGRYARATAVAAYKDSDGGRGYYSLEVATFGATCIHRRTPFHDVALNGRSIVIHTRKDHSRPYEDFEFAEVE
jgi:hypothetical protein